MILRKCNLGRVDLNCIHRLDISLKLEFSNGHNLLKICPNWAYEVFIDIYVFCRCQKTPHMPSLDKI